MAPTLQYSTDQMRQALKAVREDGMSMRAASLTYKVPRTTLSDKLKNKVPEERKMGPESVLSAVEEEQLVRWIVALGRAGFPVTKDQLLDSVKMLITKVGRETPFTNNRPGRHWYQAFLKRHPDISTRTPQNLSKARASITEEKIRNWFEEIQLYYTENDLTDVINDPQRIFNCDETAFFLSPKGNRVLIKKGEKTVYNFINSNEKECITTLVTGNAAGQLVPPMIMISCKRMPAPIVAAMPESWGLGKSDNGWMTAESFYEFIANIFHPWLLDEGIPLPVILYVDGHSSHITMALSTFCSNNQIVLVALYPNSTHILQPMDVAMFRPLKQAWKNVIHGWRMEHNAATLKRETFPPLLKQAFESIDASTNLQSGFRTCGLFPFDPDAVNYRKLLETNTARSAGDDLHDEDVSQAKQHLRYFEAQQSPEKIAIFEQSGDSWNGAAEDRSLFNYWLLSKKKAGEKVNVLETREALNVFSDDGHLNVESNAVVTTPILGECMTDPQCDIPKLVQDINTFIIDGVETIEPGGIQIIEIANVQETSTYENDGIVLFDLNAQEKRVSENLIPNHNADTTEHCGREFIESHVENTPFLKTVEDNDVGTFAESRSALRKVGEEAAFPNHQSSDGTQGRRDEQDKSTLPATAAEEPSLITITTNHTEGSFNKLAEGGAHRISPSSAQYVAKGIKDGQIGIKVAKRQNSRPTVSSISSAFEGTLFWPPALHEVNANERNTSRRRKEKVPAVVSSSRWQEYFKEKENKKEEAFLQKEERKRLREEKAKVVSEAKKRKQEAKEEKQRIAKEAKEAQNGEKIKGAKKAQNSRNPKSKKPPKTQKKKD